MTKNQSNLTVVKLLGIIICILRSLAGEDKFLEILQERNLNICRFVEVFFKQKNMLIIFSIIEDER